MEEHVRSTLRLPSPLHQRATRLVEHLAAQQGHYSLNDLYVRYIQEGLDRDAPELTVPLERVRALLQNLGLSEEEIAQRLATL